MILSNCFIFGFKTFFFFLKKHTVESLDFRPHAVRELEFFTVRYGEAHAFRSLSTLDGVYGVKVNQDCVLTHELSVDAPLA